MRKALVKRVFYRSYAGEEYTLADTFRSCTLAHIDNSVTDEEAYFYDLPSEDESSSNDEDESDSDKEQQYYDANEGDEDEGAPVQGIVTYYNAERGYGNIAFVWNYLAFSRVSPQDVKDFFFHISQVEGGEIAEDDHVEFWESYNNTKERWEATDITFPEPEDD